MFGSTKKQEESKSSITPSNIVTASGSLNALSKGSTVEGSIRCEADLRVDGHIKGKLNSTAKVIIGPTGSVEGEIRCQNAVIEGSFRGILHVSELLNVRDSASIDGDIFTNRLVVQSGAKFNAICKMGGESVSQANISTNTMTKTPVISNAKA